MYRHPPIAIKFFEDIRSVMERSENEHTPMVPDEVQLLRVGTFFHQEFGEVKITKPMLRSMIKNFENKVRGVDLAIDYKHDSHDIAAGWIEDLYLSEAGNELWARVKWTPLAQKKLHEKEFRYLSADFSMDYRDNETLKKFGPTLFGAGLTNRPVVKRMQPAVALTENPQGGAMPEDVKDVEKRLSELTSKVEAEEKKNAKLSEDLKDLKEKNTKLSEERKEQKMTYEQLEEKLNKVLAENEKLKEDAQLAEKKDEFNKLLSEGKVVEAQREHFISGDLVKFAENAGKVNLSEKGSEAPKKEDDNVSTEDKVLELADKKMKENADLEKHEAISLVLGEHPELNKKYA